MLSKGLEASRPLVQFVKRKNSIPPLLRVGLVSDIQYADIEDRVSFGGTPRYYRNTLNQLKQAVKYWNEEEVDFMLHCGDVIDLQNHADSTVEEAMSRVTSILDRAKGQVHHILGNHCVGCLNREQLRRLLRMETPSTEVGYYSISPNPSWRFLMLDSSDIAVVGRSEDHPLTQRAQKILSERNPNENKYSPEGLEGVDRRFVSFGGGISEAQMLWMKSELTEAAKQKQDVIVSCHIPLIEGLFKPVCLTWNYDEVLAILQEFPNVRLVMYGHTHKLSYLQDTAGIHHLVVPGLVEAKPDSMGFGCLCIYNDRLEFVGFNTDPIVMPFKRINVEQP